MTGEHLTVLIYSNSRLNEIAHWCDRWPEESWELSVDSSCAYSQAIVVHFDCGRKKLLFDLYWSSKYKLFESVDEHNQHVVRVIQSATFEDLPLEFGEVDSCSVTLFG